MFAFLYSLVHLYKQTSVQKRDIVYYNDLLYKIEAGISSGRDIELIENEYKCRIIFSKEINDPELVEMYADEAFVLDLIVDGEYVGKVAWLDKLEEAGFKVDYITEVKGRLYAAVFLEDVRLIDNI